MDIPRYDFTALNEPDEIRVLKLRPTRTRLEVHIYHVSVSECKFEALSYVWGKPDQANYAVVCDESDTEIGWIPLTMNLGNAMSDLRDAEELESKIFWIDQICINQADETEKGYQVAMMRQIYTQSKRVISYLGPAGPEAKEIRGIKLLKEIYGSIPDQAWGQMQEAGSLEQIQELILDGSIQLRQLSPDLQFEAGKLYDDDELSKRYAEQGWEWIFGVAYSELTQRLWIVQEQLLNKEIIMLRGPRLIDWDTILTIPILFAVGHLPQQYHDIGRRNIMMGETSLTWDKVEGILYGIWWDRHARQEHGDEYSWSSLFHNLQWYQPLLCADARDRVYAILAISRDANVLDLIPDYSPLNTVDLLSKQLSIRVLEKAINLELLIYAISWRSLNSTLPSWCLTLDQPVSLNTPEPLPFEVYTPHPRPYRYFPAHFHTDNSLLAVKGRILDYVSTPGSDITCSLTEDPSVPLQLKFLCSVEYLIRDAFSIEDIVCLLRTITAKGPWSAPSNLQAGSDEIIVFHFWAYLRHRLRTLSDSSNGNHPAVLQLINCCHQILRNTGKLLSDADKYALQGLEDVTEIESVAYDRISRYVLEQGRIIGRTATGRLFNAMDNVCHGDSIVAMQGADRLFVIRRSASGSAYKLMGDIFVDGLMNEEAYRDRDPDKIDYEIVLD
ncbi:uncharacterized protein N7483_009276 [Penicillium malachiteum]|uniref:uncharacterized protein n=1 Tax=Penicillium malachiteum TaxID=1324776 RepID=UPI0025496FAB|nr:uncharacterized protein N7483_009276 [Penicillium malachiteum]KAJ5721342.1 hypothetical protein N7483_009276 [Penicillium malachiteum]